MLWLFVFICNIGLFFFPFLSFPFDYFFRLDTYEKFSFHCSTYRHNGRNSNTVMTLIRPWLGSRFTYAVRTIIRFFFQFNTNGTRSSRFNAKNRRSCKMAPKRPWLASRFIAVRSKNRRSCKMAPNRPWLASRFIAVRTKRKSGRMLTLIRKMNQSFP